MFLLPKDTEAAGETPEAQSGETLLPPQAVGWMKGLITSQRLWKLVPLEL